MKDIQASGSKVPAGFPVFTYNNNYYISYNSPGAGRGKKFPGSRGDLAKLPGSSPEALCRQLAGFRKKGWIAVAGREVKTKDRSGLEQVSRR
ncbi:MAG: hypothetical protein COX65_01640 [Elusimicrobia bacterium CG_4_10_14_0_2_um_filter_56_8]|nr:MAG: hypothetical protein COX65_01640 [Elusimicrobia bacterium CG_4_10_14_0_2_um_filter_56_8]